MRTLIRFFLLLFLFTSCRSSRIFEAQSSPATFEGDSLFFESEEPILSYGGLGDILLLSTTLKPNKKESILINHPTFFRINSTYYIVYPGENITIGIDNDGQPIFKVKGNEQRSREFLFQNAFQTLKRKLWPEYPLRTRPYPIDTILLIEQKVKSGIPGYIIKANALFDSLATVYNVSDAFKMLCKTAWENDKYIVHSAVSSTYSVELKEGNLYQQKQRELLPLFDHITGRQKIYLGGSFPIESIAEDIMTTPIRNIKNEAQLREAMDTIKNNFKALSNDFLLTKIMYTAINNRVAFSKKTRRYYYRSCRDAAYRSIVRNLFSEKKKYAAQSKKIKDNRLISLADHKIYSIEDIIARHKGKLILIDVWASWCVPCLEQQPYMEKLHQKFAGEKISFIYLSLDKRMIEWQLKNEETGLDPNSSYLFENFDQQSSFLKKHHVETIPRYFLIGQNGKIINADAPTPDNIELEKLIRSYL